MKADDTSRNLGWSFASQSDFYAHQARANGLPSGRQAPNAL